MPLKIAADHGWPVASTGDDDNAFEAFKNERDYIAQGGKTKTTVAAMDWAAREIEHLQELLDGRDKFIVENDLWDKFVSELPKAGG